MIIQISQRSQEDDPFVLQTLRKHWGSKFIVSNGVLHDASKLPGYVAISEGEKVGLITYRNYGEFIEIVSLNSLREGIAIGSSLVRAVESLGKPVWLTTTNDNTRALRFWQKLGYRIAEVKIDVMKEYRMLKPEIPLIGLDGIEIRDEIVLKKIIGQK